MKAQAEMNANIEILVKVERDYAPAEGATYNYPGCDESMTITEILHNGTEIELDHLCEEALEQQVWDDIHEGGSQRTFYIEIPVRITGDFDYSTDQGVECSLVSCFHNGLEIIAQMDEEEKQQLEEDYINWSGQVAMKEYGR